jgi:hypothetical protein
MGAYKQFLASDIIITPLTVNKSFYFTGSSALTGSDVGIDRFIGLSTNSLFNPSTDPTTGQVNTQYQRLIYDSIKQLYYSNFLNSTSSYGSPVNTASLFPGNNEAGNVLVGTTSSEGRYYNYPQTDLTFKKLFPTEEGSQIGVISIPETLYGNYIKPNSFFISCISGSIYDDGQGNLITQNNQQICGNIFYGHGIAVITDVNSSLSSIYATSSYGSSIYGSGQADILNTFINSSNITCSFSSSLTIYETQYKCTARENEFNFSQNPSILSGSANDILYDFATGSYFQPYVTTVGLYNEQQQLLAIGKLSQPLPLPATTDVTILINIDR